jgi:fructokinase
MSNVLKIAGLGEILWDVYDDKKYLGGAPTNFAAHVNQAGQYGLILSRIGNDKLGDQLMHELISRNLDVTGIQVDDEKPTGTVKVTLDAQGKPSFDCTSDVAFDYMKFDAKWDLLSGQVDAILFGTLAQRHNVSRQAIQRFLEAATDAVKVFDVNLREWNDEVLNTVKVSFEKADIIKLNDDELELLKTSLKHEGSDHDFIRDLLKTYSIKMAAVTYGGEGCEVITDSRVVRHPGFDIKVVDTTGSGDAFAAGLTIKYVQGASLEEIAEFGNRLGAFVATRKGAVPEWTLEEVNSFA